MSATASPSFSIIVPVYNRPDEINDLLKSLDQQTDKDFEIVIVEDGSTVRCGKQCESFKKSIRIKYFYKDNEGRSIARNYGMDRADGDFFIFVDSDCILPPDYIASLKKAIAEKPADCFGGPDAAHESFSDTQKAINYAMTSFLTTGGIRGGKMSMEKFTPRTFNMGFSRKVWEKVGGFREMFSEDIDMSTRIRLAGFSITLYPDVAVFHKRRVNFKKFWRQVHVFGMSRITLQLLYPGSMKAVHWLPALFVVGALAMLIGACFCKWLILPLIIYILALWIWGIISTRSLKIGTMGVGAAMVQLSGYGTGFIRAYVWKILLRHGRDIDDEIERRRGK
ncbi:glycosyltransferase [Lepagella muris]|jgi:GT2 family glycosyltransferase|uniref:Glycosyltransferase n=1 Tax=Lepagella muris TaxID=3032870 RepID=A0AC61RBA6_9BACT|nr:glycosyltransferase [Lepagella muris]ROT04890.1 glycosyltransferase [Muribaculaceae bacterium Isolate-037 (Harlan)]TGY76191.1 glycosyltransferase [Lepagella muris]THG47310.1 glycosyltransferase [Bacteroidales bacterium]TKC62820.1 glycosyltransferase [Bacteroidales bacterium]